MAIPIPRFTITTVAGTGTKGFSGDGGPATSARISSPTSVAFDSHGNLYFADVYNERVRKVDPDGVITTVMGTGLTEPQPEDRPALETNLSSAYGIAVDSHDNLYVLNRGHGKILKLGSDGIARRIVGIGEHGFSGDGGPALEARICDPCHLVPGPDGTLYVADTGNLRIRKITPGGIITTLAGTGERGFAGDGGPAVQATIGGPTAIDIDAEGSLYVADFLNHRIRHISTDGIMTTIAGNGRPQFNGDGLLALESSIGEPCGVAVDQSGFVYIGDQVNHRVRVVTPSGRMHTVAGTGAEGYRGDDGPGEQAQLSSPDILAFDESGCLYVPDFENCAVRKLSPVI